MCKVAINKKLSPITIFAGLLVGMFAAAANAELQELADSELSEHVGQAMIAFDVAEGATAADPTFTRVTYGLNTEFQINVDELDLGNYDTGETLTSDVNISQLGLGSISTDGSATQIDGNVYAEGEIIPFMANDPYFEIAENGAGELAGFRIGFNQSRGQLSGDFTSLSGNVEMEVVDHFGQSYQSTLLDENGLADSTRASKVGVDASVTGNTGCTVATYCYDLAEFKTLEVGERNSTTGGTDATQDFFISFQKENVAWTTSKGTITAEAGAFINIPTSMQLDANTIDLNGGLYGTSRARTEYIDRGIGLF